VNINNETSKTNFGKTEKHTTALVRVIRAVHHSQVDTRLAGRALFEIIKMVDDLALVSFRIACSDGELSAGIVVESFDRHMAMTIAERVCEAASAITPTMSFMVERLYEDDPLYLPQRARYATRVKAGHREGSGISATSFSPIASHMSGGEMLVSLSMLRAADGFASDLIVVSDSAPTDVAAALLLLEISEDVELLLESGVEASATKVISSHARPQAGLSNTVFGDIFSIPSRTLEDARWGRTQRMPSSAQDVLELALSWPERGRLIIGKPGSGKSSLTETLINSDIRRGDKAILVIDPHGGLADSIKRRHKLLGSKLQIIDFGDDDCLGLNPILPEPGLPADSVRESFVTAIKDIWSGVAPELIDPSFEHVLRFAVNVVMGYSTEPSIATLVRFLQRDEEILSQVFEGIIAAGDYSLLANLQTEIDTLTEHPSGKSFVISIAAKLQVLIDDERVARIVDGTVSTLSLKDCFEPGSVLVIRAPVGILGDAAMQMLTEIVLSRFEAKVARRYAEHQSVITPVALYIDEWTTLPQPLIRRAMATGQKMGLELTCINQSVQQIDDLDLVLGLVGTFITFQIGPSEAVVFGREFTQITEHDLRRMDPFMMAVHTPDGYEGFGLAPPPFEIVSKLPQ